MSGTDCLRPMTGSDLALVRAWRNSPSVRQVMFSRHEIGADEHARWFEQASRDATRRLLILERDSVPLGHVNFSGVAPGGVADWGFYAAPGAPRGTGRTLGRLALRLAFVGEGLHKVCGRVLADNEDSLRMHRALGFHEEGVLREQHRRDEAYLDIHCFGLLAREWRAIASEDAP
jgi:UDP-4-amino-4,6-dideoxy-N-acetyl-beta-L-altrosamine N-acetyltransferase